MGAQLLDDGGPSARKGRRRRARSAAPISEINVTPFVDVMLVLLIIFMVAAPLMTVGVPIKLPETAATPLPAQDEEPLTITIASDGRLMIQTTETPADQLIPKLRAIAAERSDDQIYLRADGGIDYGVVMQVMGALNAAGFGKIGLVTDPGGPLLDGTSPDAQ
ncbi:MULTISPECIES: protein TolR [unclassified Meridianimarinicoccus]|uniref:protein TolR n=1 Tax=unclassified Meridianimarinicoccus TaxID=2923344 RepID=UPI0018672F35|nr:protein TolR [Fluviibacterium sp. MJW13]